MATPPERGSTRPPGGETAAAGARGGIYTLKKRAEFLAARKGARWATPHFVVEALRRAPAPVPTVRGPRFGFTVSKKVGGAVERNRIKRRLKAAVQGVQATHARADFDYVVIARRPALEADFARLVSDLETALARVHSARRPPRSKDRSEARRED